MMEGTVNNVKKIQLIGNKLYNGSVSAMTWMMGSDTRVRGYKYAYNGYGWLTAAEYGENADLGSNPNRYTERFLGFMPNGGIRRLQRHGLKADGVYGKVDNLHIYYDGNRITGVLDDAEPVTQNGSMDFPVSGKETAMEYNGWGALVKDQGRGISDISYDRLGNPLRISYSNGAYTEYVYSATGEKLRMTHGTSLNAASTGMEPYGDMESTEDTASEPMAAATTATSVTEYHGNIIYRDGKADMVLFPGGYATVQGSVTFHYYTQDYLGNNRAVINGSTGAIEQTTAYYPYGGVIADLGNPTGGQPYRFGGKELVTANGLNEYDFGARWYYSVLLHFTAVDPSCEKYYWLSPYLYCANNPVNLTDPTGKDLCVLNYGNDIRHQHLAMLIQDENGKWQYFSVNGNNVYISGEHKGGRTFNDVGVGQWDTPEDFINSDYNVRNEDSKDDESMNNFGFEEGYVIESTPDQDKIMIETFTQVAESEYSLLGNNCAIAVQKTMFEADISVAQPKFNKTFVPANKTLGESSFNIITPNFNAVPSVAFKSIMKQNPLGRYIHK